MGCRALIDVRGVMAGRAEVAGGGAPETDSPRPLRAAIRSLSETNTGSSSSGSAALLDELDCVTGGSDGTVDWVEFGGVGFSLGGGVQCRAGAELAVCEA